MYKFFIVGLNNGSFKSYELETSRQDWTWNVAENGISDPVDKILINSLIDLPELPFFISGDNFGNVVLWSTSPILDKYMSFHIFKLKFLETDAQG